MTFEDWHGKVARLEADIYKARVALDAAIEKRNVFMRSTIGFSPGDVATVEGTAVMVRKVMAMPSKKRKSK